MNQEREREWKSRRRKRFARHGQSRDPSAVIVNALEGEENAWEEGGGGPAKNDEALTRRERVEITAVTFAIELAKLVRNSRLARITVEK